MSIKVNDLSKAIMEAHRFLEAAKDLQNQGRVYSGYSDHEYESGKLTSAVKRASMDLTRALPALRRRS